MQTLMNSDSFKAYHKGPLPDCFEKWCDDVVGHRPDIVATGDLTEVIFTRPEDMLLFGMKFGWIDCEYA